MQAEMSAPLTRTSVSIPWEDLQPGDRRAFDPKTCELMQRFARVCASGDLASVSKLVDTGPRHSYPEYLSGGLTRAILGKQIQVTEFLLDKGAVMDRAAPGAAARTRSLPVFKLLRKHGWDINFPIMQDITPLM